MVLSDQQLSQINRARALLEKIEEANDKNRFRDGKLSEACRAAEHSLLNVLSIYSAYVQTLPDSVLYNERPAPTGAPDDNGHS